MEEFDFSEAMSKPGEPEVLGEVGEIVMPVSSDIRPVILSLVPYQAKVQELVKLARDIRVTDKESQVRTTELALVAKKVRLKVESIKKSEIYLEANSVVTGLRHICNALSEPLKNQVEDVCKDKLTAYTRSLILAQERREAAAREEARQLQAKLDAEAAQLRAEAEAKAQAAADELARQEAAGQLSETEKAILEKTVEEEREAAARIVAPQVVVAVPATDKTVRTEEGSSYTRSRWVAELVDINLVPREYLVVDEKAVRRAVDGGIRQIPGFTIKEHLSTSVRG